jgi:hypothetical protein
MGQISGFGRLIKRRTRDVAGKKHPFINQLSNFHSKVIWNMPYGILVDFF